MSEKNVSQLTQLPVLRVIYVIDCEIENGVVTNAWSSGTMWRGMENIVKGPTLVMLG